MKKIIAIAIILLTLAGQNVANGLVPIPPEPNYLLKIGNALVGKFSAMDLGTSVRPFGSIFAGALTISGITLSGNLNMGGHNITSVGSVNASGANGNLSLLPTGTGYVNVSTSLAPVSLGTSGGLNTTNLEASGSIFTGGLTMATDRGDVPWVDWSVTSASADGTAQSLPFLIDGQWIGEPYAESNGAGGVQNMEWRTRNLRNYGDLITTRMTLPNGTALPATCAVGNVFLDTDDDDCSDSGGGDGALCICKSSDTWVLLNNI